MAEVPAPSTQTTADVADDDENTTNEIPRRNFLHLAGAMSAGAVLTQYSTGIANALELAINGDVEVTWLQGQTCTGCTNSVLQAQYPTLEDVIEEFRLSVTFQPTLMPLAGEPALEAMSKEPDVLIVEGSIPTEMPKAATLGRTADGEPKSMYDWVTEIAPNADVVVAIGNCAAFGGWPAAENRRRLYGLGRNVTGAQGMQFERRSKGGVVGPDFTSNLDLPVVNLGGCPVHPDYVLLTLATVLNGHIPELDRYNRPYPFYEPLVHDNCALRGYFDRGEFADKPGDEGCLIKTGCAGPYTRCDDQMRLWNDGTSVCMNVGAPCIGCMEPGFWDRFSPFMQEHESSPILGNISAEQVGYAAVIAAAVGIGAHVGRKLTGYGKFEQEQEETDD